MAGLRVFIAAPLAPEGKSALSLLQAGLALSPCPVKWVNPGGIHLTLKFLGTVESALLPEIAGAIRQATTGTAPFRLSLGGPGAFPNTGRPQVVWAGLDGDLRPLLGIQQRLEEALAALGFPRENKPFRPHLTLGRVRDQASIGERQELGRRIQAVNRGVSLSFTVESLELMKSDLRPTGAVYSSLETVALA